MSYKLTKWIFYGMSAGTCIALLLGALTELIVFSYIAVFLAFAVIIFRILFWRCPHCRKLLGRKDDTHCHHCGEQLEGEE